MAVKVPSFQSLAEITDWLTRVFRERDREFAAFMRNDSANHSVLLYSPSKKVYELTVNDAGVVTTTLVSG